MKSSGPTAAGGFQNALDFLQMKAAPQSLTYTSIKKKQSRPKFVDLREELCPELIQMYAQRQ